MTYKKNKTYTDKAMIGYIDGGDNVVAIEPGWNNGTPEVLGKTLVEKFPTKEDAIRFINSASSLPQFRKEDYWYVDGFGEVIDKRVSMHPENYREHIGHLYLWMKGEWQYSDCGIDWEPVREVINEAG